MLSTAAEKRLETEAIAGVSLVADAAEYLEQGYTNKQIEEAPGQYAFLNLVEAGLSCN